MIPTTDRCYRLLPLTARWTLVNRGGGGGGGWGWTRAVLTPATFPRTVQYLPRWAQTGENIGGPAGLVRGLGVHTQGHPDGSLIERGAGGGGGGNRTSGFHKE